MLLPASWGIEEATPIRYYAGFVKLANEVELVWVPFRWAKEGDVMLLGKNWCVVPTVRDG